MSYYAPDEPPVSPPSGRPGRAALATIVVLLGVALGGIVLGLLWYLIAPPLPLRKVEGGMAYTSPDPEQLVAQDGWFTILGFAFGIVAAVLVWTLARKWRGPLQLVALALGATAAGFLAWKMGTAIGQDAYRNLVASAPIDTIIERPIELSATTTKNCIGKRCISFPAGNILVPGLGAVIGYALLAGWSRWPSLRREEDEALQAQMQWLALQQQQQQQPYGYGDAWGAGGSEQPGQPGPGGQAGPGGQPGYPGQAGQFGQPGQPGQFGQPGQPGYSGQAGYPGQPGGVEGQPGQFGQPGYPGQSGSGAQQGQPAQAGQPGYGTQSSLPGWPGPGASSSSESSPGESGRGEPGGDVSGGGEPGVDSSGREESGRGEPGGGEPGRDVSGGGEPGRR